MISDGSRKFLDIPLFVVLLACLLLAALKVETGVAETGEQLADLLSPPWLETIRGQLLSVFLVVIGAASCWSLFSGQLRLRVSILFMLACAIPLYGAFRSSFDDTELAWKSLLAFSLFAFLATFIAFRRANVGAEVVTGTASAAFAAFAFALVTLNLVMYVIGYGYLGRNERFYGSAIHPNFLGVQMAICVLVLSHLTVTARPLLKIFAAVFLTGALFLLMQTGSRTALIILGSGFCVGVWPMIGFRGRMLLCATLVALLSILSVSGLPDGSTLGAYGRGGIFDTRSIAWSEMAERIVRRPMLGLGTFAGASENSLMRGWAAFGLPYFLIMLSVIVLGLVSSCRIIAHQERLCPANQIAAGLFCGLVAGSMFEGYLCDNMSVPVLTFIIASSLVGASVAEHNQPHFQELLNARSTDGTLSAR
jgi:hypothetical protein